MRIAIQLGIAFAQYLESVLIEAHPDVEAVLLDAIVGAATGSALAAEAPSGLINGDVKLPLMLRPREFESGGDSSTATADHGDFDGFLTTHFK
jgi:hypothetical protein